MFFPNLGLTLIQEVKLYSHILALHPLDFFFFFYVLLKASFFILILMVSRQPIVCGSPDESLLAVTDHPSYSLSLRLTSDAAISGFEAIPGRLLNASSLFVCRD